MHQMKMHTTIRVNSTATTTTSTSSNKVKKNLTQVKEVPKEKTGMKVRTFSHSLVYKGTKSFLCL